MGGTLGREASERKVFVGRREQRSGGGGFAAQACCLLGQEGWGEIWERRREGERAGGRAGRWVEGAVFQ